MPDRDWMDLAHGDLAAARSLAASGLWDQAAFHAHEATEKALKGVIAHGDVVPAKTHDLTRLAHDARVPDPLARRMDAFSGVYMGTRYPGMPIRFDDEMVDRLMQLAEEVIGWAEHRS